LSSCFQQKKAITMLPAEEDNSRTTLILEKSSERTPELHAWRQAVKAKEKKAKAKEKADKAAERKAAEKEKKDKKAAVDKEKKAAAKAKASGKTPAKKTHAKAKEAQKEAEPSAKKEKRKAPAKETPRKVGLPLYLLRERIVSWQEGSIEHLQISQCHS
jgi:hypothetical protein